MLGLSALIAYCLNNSEIQCQECDLTFNSEEELRHHVTTSVIKVTEQDLSKTNKLQSDSKMTDSETLGPLPKEDRANEMATDKKFGAMYAGQISGFRTVQ